MHDTGGAEWSAAAAAWAAGPAWERETGRQRETAARAVNRAAGSEPERERTGRPPRGPRAPPERSCGREEDAAMGLLSQGSPLSWEETQRHADHVRRHGILQFLHIYHAVKDRHKDVLKWGDEVSPRAFVRPGRPPPRHRPRLGAGDSGSFIPVGTKATRILGGPEREGCVWVNSCLPASGRTVRLGDECERDRPAPAGSLSRFKSPGCLLQPS